MNAKALPGNDSRYVQLKLSLKEVPDILLDHFGAQDKYVLSHLCLAFYMLCGVLLLLPGSELSVEQSMAVHGIETLVSHVSMHSKYVFFSMQKYVHSCDNLLLYLFSACQNKNILKHFNNI